MDPAADRAARDRFRALVREVADPVRRYLWRRTDEATADEVLAETLVVLWRRFDDEPREPIPWAIGIARKVLAAYLSRRLSTRSASGFPPVWQVGQYWNVESE